MYISEEVKKQIDSLRRCQNLEEVTRLHEKGSHETVVNLLLETFSQPVNKVVHMYIIITIEPLFTTY